MPVPLVPYPPQSAMAAAPPSGSQGQLVCSGCRTLLVYPQGAANVRCALCSIVTAVPPPGDAVNETHSRNRDLYHVIGQENTWTEMAQLICGGCRTLLMYVRGATSVQCSCCHTVNIAMEANPIAHVTCGGCRTTLMYPYGAPTVKCAVCQFVTATGIHNPRVPIPSQQSSTNGSTSQPSPQSQQSSSHAHTVVVENPMTLDDSGKLVSNVAVGVTSEKK